MNELQIFEKGNWSLRITDKEGGAWFVAADVCKALDLGNTAQAMTRLDEDEKGVISNDTPGGKQEMTIISEPGLYSLVLGSRKPEAKTFKRWVTHEVIPAIRKTGSYLAPGASTHCPILTEGLARELRLIYGDFQAAHRIDQYIMGWTAADEPPKASQAWTAGLFTKTEMHRRFRTAPKRDGKVHWRSCGLYAPQFRELCAAASITPKDWLTPAECHWLAEWVFALEARQ